MKEQSLDTWRAEAAARFGNATFHWAFRCPACGHVATVADFETLGKDANDAYQQCIGRVNGNMHPASKATEDDGQGCDWCAYGLLGTMGNGRVVITDDGKRVEVFDFA